MKNKVTLLMSIVLCILMYMTSYAQEKNVNGTVKDATGIPLPGVNVVIKNTTTGAQTNFDGNFTINAKPGDILILSFIGMKTTEITVDSNSSYNIVLEDDAAQLDEVVVVGYGTQKKGNVTSSIASMKTDLLDQRPVSAVDQAMVGQMAGVRVIQTSGVPGQGFSVQVRGAGSISANNQPLYVIDGFPIDQQSQSSSGSFGSGNPLDNISPNDIESIQVLKDAAAAAIYGSRASNGVVIITTKGGKSGAPVINFNTYAGVNKTVKKLDVLSAEEWIERASEYIDNRWVNSGPGRTASQTSAEREAINGGFNNNLIKDDRWALPGHPGLEFVDWQDELFRTGLVQNYQISARGGTDQVKYYVSADHLNQEGVALGVGYKRYSARANVEVKLSDKLSFGLNISPSYSISSNPGVDGKDRQLHIAVSANPVNEDGIDYNVGDNTRYTWGTSRPSPVRYVQNTTGDNKLFRTLTTMFTKYEIIPGLNVKTSINLDNSDSSYKFFTPSTTDRNRTASGSHRTYRKQSFVNENTITYDKTFNQKHNLNLLAGGSYSSYKFEAQRISSTGGFATDLITVLNANTTIRTDRTDTSESKRVLMSYFGRAQYNFDDRYLLTGSIRRDGSSNFGRDTKWGFFPSASLGWKISNEKFMSKQTSISDLKLRASWGIAGNNGVGDYASIATLGFANYSLGGSIIPGQAPSNSANADLSWETAETYDVGLDLGLFNNRIFISADYYTKTNSDLLLNVPVPRASGFGSAITNIGEVENKGWELELTTRNFTERDFNWTTNINLSHNENVVKKLGPDNSPIYGGGFDIQHNVLMVGEPMYSLFLVQRDGILSQEDIDSGYPTLGSNQQAGDHKYVDFDGNGSIGPEDRQLSGDPSPDLLWSVNNTFKYKNFDLSVLVQGQQGGLIYSTFGRAINRTSMGFLENVVGRVRDRWRSAENPGAGIEGRVNGSFGRIKNTDWLYSSDYWRIRNITLGYDLGAVVGTKVFKGARIYVTMENWFGGDKYSGGFNPEAVNNSGDDYGGFPLSKSIITGLNFTF
ncbi:SusC/RagA family TonB-linked outer membrane protein [Thalassobellus suaedae]|uniref:TonB-dependent receptor n=1 Tax=Thalassobellus suaedae TaxID=3074124 RepID=A0ABY9XXL9_9FLAO|nr:TonB-dependent receptor [Flavobacteriaceae bacterium HL-DH14]